jgi:hypothetical protein
MPEESTRLPKMLVRGVSLISLHKYLKSRLSEKDIKRFFESMPITHALTVLKAKKWMWYPFDVQRELRKAIARKFNSSRPREAVYDAGLFAALYETSTFLRAMLSFVPVPVVINNSQMIWRKYYSPGKLHGVMASNNHAIVELTEFPSDPIFCPMVESWLVIAAQSLGLKNATVKETACIYKGDICCRWETTWEP